ncbi:MAG: DUF1501 domain-containing protein, partial [Pirellulales bacterium]
MHRNPLPPVSRRDALHRIGAGFGTLGLAGVMADSGLVATAATSQSGSPLDPKPPHFAPKAKHVI